MGNLQIDHSFVKKILIPIICALLSVSLFAQEAPSTKEQEVGMTFEKIIAQYFVSQPLLKGEESLLFVEVKINGKNSLLLVDSGASSIILDLSVAKAHEIKLSPGGTASDVYNKGDKVYRGVVKSFVMGEGIEMKEQVVNFLNLERIQEYSFPGGKKRKISGIVGLAFFNSIPCAIDYPNSRFLVAKEKINGGLSGIQKRVGYRHIKLHQQPDGRCYVLTKLKDESTYFLVDTGSNTNVIYLDAAKSRGYEIINVEGKMQTISGKAGQLQIAKVPQVQIELVRLEDQVMHILPSGGDVAKIGDIPVVGILGGGLLDALRATIDFETKEMTMALGGQ